MFFQRLWAIAYFLMLFLLSFSVLKIPLGFEARVGQIFILLLFGLILLYDIRYKTLNLKILFFFLFFGLLVSVISKISPYEKVGEMKFIIKYLLIFPASFYVGMKVFQLLPVKKVVFILETVAVLYGIIAFLLYMHPVPSLMHVREGYNDFQGTFYEPSGLAEAIGLILISSFALRLQFNLWNRPYLVFSTYTFLLIVALMTRNKMIWIGIFGVLLFSIFYKFFSAFRLKGKISFSDFADTYRNIVENMKKISVLKILLILISFGVFLYVYNASLEEPIISEKILEEKIHTERGKALIATLKLLEKSHWIGGYGFGFVESYFSKSREEILGLGEGVSMIFNSYLDAWLSGSFINLIFHLSVLFISFSTDFLISSFIPVFLFIGANLNPLYGDEYYYLFLGMSFGAKIFLKKKEKEKEVDYSY